MSGDLQWFTSLRHVFDRSQPQARILPVTIDPVGADPLGALNGGRLCIQGQCIETNSTLMAEFMVQAIGPHSSNGTMRGPVEQITPRGFQRGLFLANDQDHAGRIYW